jgi:hypothetical protein
MSRRDREDLVRAWLRSGPETASPDFVDRTLAPIPHMRQRGRWRIQLQHASAAPRELGALLAAAAAIVIVFVVIVSSQPGLGGPGGSPSPSPGVHPTSALQVTGGPGAGTYRSDPSALTNLCTEAADGSFRLNYGDPVVTIDMLVGAGAREPGASTQVAAEIEAGVGYVRFDPEILRGGDPPGRSTASVSVEERSGSTTFVVTAITPDRTTGIDGAAVQIDLTVVCPG